MLYSSCTHMATVGVKGFKLYLGLSVGGSTQFVVLNVAGHPLSVAYQFHIIY